MEREHPWFNRVGLSAEEKGYFQLAVVPEGRYFITTGTDEPDVPEPITAKPSDRLQLILPKSDEVARRIIDLFDRYISRTKAIRAQQERQYAGYL